MHANHMPLYSDPQLKLIHFYQKFQFLPNCRINYQSSPSHVYNLLIIDVGRNLLIIAETILKL